MQHLNLSADLQASKNRDPIPATAFNEPLLCDNGYIASTSSCSS
jgi:hypothetical protein